MVPVRWPGVPGTTTAVIGLEDRLILPVQMLVPAFAGIEGKQKRIIRVVRVEHVDTPQVEGLFSGIVAKNALSRL